MEQVRESRGEERVFFFFWKKGLLSAGVTAKFGLAPSLQCGAGCGDAATRTQVDHPCCAF